MSPIDTDMSILGDRETKTVTIEPPEELIEHARQRAGPGEELEEHLLDLYLFEYDWVGVDED